MAERVGMHRRATRGRVAEVLGLIAKYNRHQRAGRLLQLKPSDAEVVAEAVIQILEPIGPFVALPAGMNDHVMASRGYFEAIIKLVLEQRFHFGCRVRDVSRACL